MENTTNPKQRNFVVGLIIIGIIIIAIFGIRTARAFRQFHGPPPPFADQPVETDVNLIRDWMTVPFIAHTYHVRPSTLFESLGIPEKGNGEKSLRQLNEEYFPKKKGLVLETVKAAVQAALPPTVPALATPPATVKPPQP